MGRIRGDLWQGSRECSQLPRLRHKGDSEGLVLVELLNIATKMAKGFQFLSVAPDLMNLVGLAVVRGDC